MDSDDENCDMWLFLAMSYSVQMIGKYMGRINMRTRNSLLGIDWNGWCGYRLKLAHKIDEIHLHRMKEEIENAGTILTEQLDYLLSG